jgi:hypothetical protein
VKGGGGDVNSGICLEVAADSAILGRMTGKPEVNCCYLAFALITRIGGQKMPIAGTPASGTVDAYLVSA